MNKWYIGQPIVCIKSRKDNAIKKGEDFVIKGLISSFCKCASFVIIDVGIDALTQYQCCKKCGTYHVPCNGILWTAEFLFAPLDQDISELTEILTQEEPIKI